MVEDCFNFQKNSKHVKGKKKSRRPEKCMGVVLARKVLSKQHRYGELEVDSGISSRAIGLPAAAFQQPVNAAIGASGEHCFQAQLVQPSSFKLRTTSIRLTCRWRRQHPALARGTTCPLAG